MPSKTKTTNQADEVITDESPFDFLFGLDAPSDHEFWADKYRYFQWNNNEKAFEFPVKHWGGTSLAEGQEAVEVDHANGAEIELSFLIPDVTLTVIAYRFTWERKVGDSKVFAAEPVSGENGWKKRYNFLCLIRNAETDEPCILTAAGWTADFIYNAIYQYRKRITKLAANLSGAAVPPGYIFWCPLAAGERKLVGKKDKSVIYPPAAVIDEFAAENGAELVTSMYIGDFLTQEISRHLFDEAQRWAGEPIAALLPATSQAADLTMARFDELGQLIIPDLANEKRALWHRWIESALGLLDGEGGAVATKVIKANRYKSGNAVRGTWEWGAIAEYVASQSNEADEAARREVMLRN